MSRLSIITTDAGRGAILDAQTAGLKVSITHVAAGSAAYDPETRRDATSLLNEEQRVPIVSSKVVAEEYRLDINALFAGATEFWIREVGFFDEDGVLVWLWSSPNEEDTLGYKSIPARFLLGMSLTVTDCPLTSIEIVDEGQPLELSLEPLQQEIDRLFVVTQFNDQFGEVHPVSCAPFPEVCAADKLIAGINTYTQAGSGGSVGIISQNYVYIGEVVTTKNLPVGSEWPIGKTVAGLSALPNLGATPVCRMAWRPLGTWVSPNLASNSTYFLRAKVINGVLTPYVQRGDDADTIPATFLGTVNGSTGGGFDSTPVDILLAKVVTGSAGGSPTVTALANARVLRRVVQIVTNVVGPQLTWAALPNATVTLNWARNPSDAQPVAQFVAGIANKPDGTYDGTQPPTFSPPFVYHNLMMIGARRASGSNRYSLLAEYAYQDSNNDSGTLNLVWSPIV